MVASVRANAAYHLPPHKRHRQAPSITTGSAQRGCYTMSARTRASADTPLRGLTVPKFAKLFCIGETKVIGWIRAGKLRAVNVATDLCGRPRFVILPDAVAEFQRQRDPTGPQPEIETTPRRKRCTAGQKD